MKGNEKEPSLHEKNGKALSRVTFISCCILSALLLLFSVLCILPLLFTPTGKTPEIFGYSVFVCESDINESGIKAGSLVLIKGAYDIEPFTAETLVLGDIKVFPKIGGYIKKLTSPVAVCIVTPVAAFLTACLISELYKISLKNCHDELERKIEIEE